MFGWDTVVLLLAVVFCVFLLLVFIGTRERAYVRVIGIWPDTYTGGINARAEMFSMYDTPQIDLVVLHGDIVSADIVAALERREYDVCHIGSHAVDGMIELSRGTYISGGWIARALRSRDVHMVILNACDSHEIGDILFQSGVGCVVTTLVAVGDAQAIEFSRVFYKALSRHRSARKAFDIAVLAVGQESIGVFSIVGEYKV